MDGDRDEFRPVGVTIVPCDSEWASADEPTSIMLTQGNDDEIVDLEPRHDATSAAPQLTLILPDEAADRPAPEPLVLVTDADDRVSSESRDSSAYTSFTEWAAQVSSCFTAPSDETDAAPEGSRDAARQKKRATRDVAAENLWSSIEPTLHVIEPPPLPAVCYPAITMSDELEGEEPPLAAASACGGPMAPPPPTPPEWIGRGRRTDRPNPAGQPNPFMGLLRGLDGFRWWKMWRTAGVTAAGGALLVLLRQVFA